MRFAGMDECGTGALAGPMVACCVSVEAPVDGMDALKTWWPLREVTDSKKLSPLGRERVARDICAYLIEVEGEVGYGQAEVDEINTLGHLAAWRLAMTRAFEGMRAHVRVQRLLTDGNVPVGIAGVPEFPFPKGDSLFFPIAAASILGKVHRDNLMTKMGEEYPGYDFASSKGYPTGSHIWAVDHYGLTQQHRLRPCETVLKKWRAGGASSAPRPTG